ncbi:hypothetical protein C8R45DRAFT_1008894 [Mycena sanguinolenta]|nr:hypothetical protein C8R45DRAFT_1008894 [Mycena sanguinolenta]
MLVLRILLLRPCVPISPPPTRPHELDLIAAVMPILPLVSLVVVLLLLVFAEALLLLVHRVCIFETNHPGPARSGGGGAGRGEDDFCELKDQGHKGTHQRKRRPLRDAPREARARDQERRTGDAVREAAKEGGMSAWSRINERKTVVCVRARLSARLWPVSFAARPHLSPVALACSQSHHLRSSRLHKRRNAGRHVAHAPANKGKKGQDVKNSQTPNHTPRKHQMARRPQCRQRYLHPLPYPFSYSPYSRRYPS